MEQLVTFDLDTILTTWEKHFKDLGRSREEQFPVLSGTKKQEDQFLVKSLENEEIVLDVPFCSEEIDGALRRLKLGKSAGHGLLQPEHLKHGGEALKICYQQVCNAVIELESVPDSLKLEIVTPIYKGSGKDPLDTNSYQGITLTPVLTKVFESLILDHLQDVLLEKGIPHSIKLAIGRTFHVWRQSSPWKLSRNLPSRGRECTCAFTTSIKPLIWCNTLSFSSAYMK